MLITYIRSSLVGRYQFCNHAAWIEYSLGYKSPGGHKAEKGNILHKALELLALNKERTVDDVFQEACNHYITSSIHTYKQKDVDDCRKWLDKALTFKNGIYDPRKLDIIAVEKSFDIEFKEDWARYSYKLKDKVIEGYFAIKGNVDMISRYSPSIIQLTDYKTGKRIDWATGKEKDYKALENDFQLQLYALALSHLYPKQDIFIDIYYVNDGNCFTIPFDRTKLGKVKDRVIQQYLTIKNDEEPKLLSPNRTNWKCTKLCPFFKIQKEGLTLCEYLYRERRIKGIEKATIDNMEEGYNPTQYGYGGGAEGLKNESK